MVAETPAVGGHLARRTPVAVVGTPSQRDTKTRGQLVRGTPAADAGTPSQGDQGDTSRWDTLSGGHAVRGKPSQRDTDNSRWDSSSLSSKDYDQRLN